MIAPIDGSDPPERPPTPANFDARNRSIQAKSSQGYAQAMRQGMRQGFRGATVIVIGVRQRQDHGHEWNAPWP